jgi:SAM-dependent methyltransferase
MRLPATERFTDRADDYRQYRPRYPAAIVDLLARDCNLSRDATIADIAAGTGLLAEIFLAHSNRVIAIEPNVRMREACATLQSIYRRLECVDGTAENTHLSESSVDMVTVGQAMHWFDLPRARAEFARILRSGGWCVIAYNHRRRSGDAFHEGYERLLNEFGIDYREVQSDHLTDERLQEFFHPAVMRQRSLLNVQTLDLEGLHGRIVSSSYMPQPGHARYEELQRAVEPLFEQCQKDGSVRLEYDCVVSYGQLG